MLIDRLWPRGVRKGDIAFDDWAKDVAPSPELRRWFHQDPAARWPDFRTRYLRELRENDAVDRLVEAARRGTITLLFGARDPKRNHAVVLRQFLEERLR
ncbi:MAG: DUF488 family protein [Gemmatimonadota bacterium]|nr:DUF488 family protein [Gemmatimonadota bacterium]